MEILFIIIVGIAVLLSKSASESKSKAKGSRPNTPRQQHRPQQPAGVRSGQPQQRQAGQWNGQPRPQQSAGVRSSQPQPDIVQRAKANNARFDEDTTRESIEAMHGHSEAERKVEFEHSRNCQTLGSDDNNRVEAETKSMFGSVEDLIAMGYSGNLEFERDFLGEGLDMISRFY